MSSLKAQDGPCLRPAFHHCEALSLLLRNGQRYPCSGTLLGTPPIPFLPASVSSHSHDSSNKKIIVADTSSSWDKGRARPRRASSLLPASAAADRVALAAPRSPWRWRATWRASPIWTRPCRGGCRTCSPRAWCVRGARQAGRAGCTRCAQGKRDPPDPPDAATRRSMRSARPATWTTARWAT